MPKGFVCVDGTSLTICEVNVEQSWFTFMLVAHTQQNVIIPKKTIGEKSWLLSSNFPIHSFIFSLILFIY